MPPKSRMGKILEISLPTPEHKQKIKEAAKKRGCTVSKYISTVVDDAERQDRPRPVSGQDLQALREENRRITTELHGKDLIMAQQEAELRKLRGAAFLQPTWDADIDSDLLRILHDGPIHDHRLLAALGIEPRDTEAVRAVSKQLQILETMRFISKTPHGWRWRG